MDNWRAEAERFYPNLRVHLWRGEPANELPAVRDSAELIVINYAQLRTLRLLQKQKAALAEDVFGEERFAQSLTLDDLRFLFAE